MSNSSLVQFTKISPNRTVNRNHKIDTITIHCMAGDCSIENLGGWFAKATTQASSNYGVGSDGRIGMYVEEKDRSWCTSNRDNDMRAITIEVANCGGAEEGWPVTDKAYNALIELVADICRRNDIKELKWKNDKSLIGQVDKQNMTVHCWFKNKSCPGKYLLDRHGDIAAKVNAKLGVSTPAPAPAPAPETEGKIYRVQVGAYKKKANAETQLKKVKAAGYSAFIAKVGEYYKVQVGAYSVKKNAENMLAKIKASGFSAIIAESKGETVEVTPAKIAVGSKVKVKKGAKTYTGSTLKSFVYDRVHTVKQIGGNRVVITYNNIVVAAVNINDLELV